MNVSYPFIRRPIGTTLLAIGLFLAGVVAYHVLPVASLPAVELPTISVTASRPGADPETMAATIAAPLERRLGEISGVTELTSRSSLGSSRITVQFDLSRNIDGAARDVQAALNAALTDLPGDLPNLPSFRKSNPAAAPVLILALTSRTIAPSALYDIADSVLAQRISQTEGVGDVTVSGAEQPAVRVRVNPAALAMTGISMEQVRTTISNANSIGPVGAFDGPANAETIATNAQLQQPRDYETLVVKAANGDVVRLSHIATVERGVRNSRSASWFNGQPSVLLIITKDSTANVIETVERIKDLLPELKRWIPADIDISVLSDRSQTIKAGINHLQFALLVTIVLVMMVVFVFLRRAAATIAAGVTVPLALAGTCAAMWMVRLFAQQRFASGAGRLGRLCRRRRDRDDRKYLPQSRARHVAASGSARRRAPDRLHRHFHQHLADRRVYPAAVHGGRHWPLPPRILRHADFRGRNLDCGFAVGDANDLRLFRPLGAEQDGDLAGSRGGSGARADDARLCPQPRISPCNIAR